MSLLVACPVIGPPAEDVLASWDHRPHLLLVNGNGVAWDEAADTLRCGVWTQTEQDTEDAPERTINVGVAASWNQAFRWAASVGHQYVALISQNLVLTNGTGRLAELVQLHADRRGLLTDFAWRCIVLSVDLWHAVGPFDEQFLAYYEDNDYVRRLELAGLHTAANPIPKIGRDLLDAQRDDVAVTLKSGLIAEHVYGESAKKYRKKWGGRPGRELWTEPYNGRR